MHRRVAQLPSASEDLTMNSFGETCFVEFKIAQVFSASVKDEKKLVLTREDVNTMRSLLDQLYRFQRQLCQDVLAPLLRRHGLNVDIVTLLEFNDLTKCLIKRDTDAGIMEDDLQRFRLFLAAERLVTKSATERGQELSDNLESLLTDMTSMIWRVLRKNDISPPDSPRSEHLEERLNRTTKEFLGEIFGEHNKENVWMAEVTIEEDFTDNNDVDMKAVSDVRNYVIIRDLRDALQNFQRNLGHLIR
ncbi:hypothetical protein ACROYT_G004673 [Oculina patagonica]